MVTEHDTYTKAEYDRPLDPGEGFTSLRDLFGYNNDAMEEDQQEEVEASIADYRLRGFYIKKGNHAKYGMLIEGGPKRLDEGQLLSEDVFVKKLQTTGAIAADDNIMIGDRLIKINGQWVLCLEHAQYLLYEMLGKAPALDLTVCRKEEKPLAWDMTKMSDSELQEAAFTHAGLRVLIHEKKGWSREQVERVLHTRMKLSDKSTEMQEELVSDEEC